MELDGFTQRGRRRLEPRLLPDRQGSRSPLTEIRINVRTQ